MLENTEFLIYCLLSRQHSRKCTQNIEHTHSQFISCIRIMYCTCRMETFFGNNGIKCAYYWFSIDVFSFTNLEWHFQCSIQCSMLHCYLNEFLSISFILSVFLWSCIFSIRFQKTVFFPFNQMREERFLSCTFCTITFKNSAKLGIEYCYVLRCFCSLEYNLWWKWGNLNKSTKKKL